MVLFGPRDDDPAVGLVREIILAVCPASSWLRQYTWRNMERWPSSADTPSAERASSVIPSVAARGAAFVTRQRATGPLGHDKDLASAHRHVGTASKLAGIRHETLVAPRPVALAGGALNLAGSGVLSPGVRSPGGLDAEA